MTRPIRLIIATLALAACGLGFGATHVIHGADRYGQATIHSADYYASPDQIGTCRTCYE